MYRCVDAAAIMLVRTTMPLAAPPGVPGGVAAGAAATSGPIQLLPRRPGRTRQLPARSWPEGLVWCSVRSRRFAARSGLAFGLALAVSARRVGRGLRRSRAGALDAGGADPDNALFPSRLFAPVWLFTAGAVRPGAPKVRP